MLGQKTEVLAILNRVEIASLPHYMYGYSASYDKEDAVESVGKYERLARLSRSADSSTNR